MVEFFDAILQLAENFMEFLDWIWNFIQYIVQHFGLTLLVDLALATVSIALAFISNVADLVGAQAFADGMDDAAAILESDTINHFFNVCGYILDYFVPVEFLNAVLGMMVIVWMYGFICAHVWKIYHQFWGSK